MRIKVVVGGVVAVLVGLLIAACFGAFTPKVSGTAVPNEATRTQKTLSDIALSLAKAPGAKYTGVLTGPSSYRLEVIDVTVTAAGDVSGVVTLKGERADWMQIGGLTLVKAGSEFWRDRSADPLPKGIRIGSVAGKWTLAPDDLLGVDLRAALRPQRLGLTALQQDTLIGGGDLTGDAVGRGGETPDRRVAVTRDLTGVVVLDGDDSTDEKATVRLRAGDTTVGADDAHTMVSLRGPLGGGFVGAAAGMSADLKVSVLDAEQATSFYTKAGGDVRSKAPYAAWRIGVPEPDGNLDCGGASCALTYHIANTVPGATGGEVSMTLSGTLTGGARGVCNASGSMPVNGRGTVTCRTPYSGGGDVNSSSFVVLTARATVDQAAVDSAIARGKTLVADTGAWRPGAPKASDVARDFHRQIAGGPSGYTLIVGGFAFDGREPDGTLLVVNGPGYDAHVVGAGFDPAWAGAEQVLSQAKDASSAAGGKPVRMVFAEQRAGDAARALLAANQVSGVDVVVVPAIPPAE